MSTVVQIKRDIRSRDILQKTCDRLGCTVTGTDPYAYVVLPSGTQMSIDLRTGNQLDSDFQRRRSVTQQRDLDQFAMEYQLELLSQLSLRPIDQLQVVRLDGSIELELTLSETTTP